MNLNPVTWYKGYTEKAQPRIYLEKKVINAFVVVVSIVGALIICLFSSCQMTPARAETVNLDIIAQIESSNNPSAYAAQSCASGMYQFTPIAWQDVQEHFPSLRKYPFSYAYEPQVARLFAKAYFVLIDRYLRHFGLKTSLSNQLACYNQGIGLTRKGILSKESRNYIAKYQRLEKS